MLERVKVAQDEEWAWAAEAEWAVVVAVAEEWVWAEAMVVVAVKAAEDAIEVAEAEISDKPGTYSNTRFCR